MILALEHCRTPLTYFDQAYSRAFILFLYTAKHNVISEFEKSFVTEPHITCCHVTECQSQDAAL